jgi:hypothetical protein
MTPSILVESYSLVWAGPKSAATPWRDSRLGSGFAFDRVSGLVILARL